MRAFKTAIGSRSGASESGQEGVIARWVGYRQDDVVQEHSGQVDSWVVDRPNIQHAMCVCSMSMASLGVGDWYKLKRDARYVRIMFTWQTADSLCRATVIGEETGGRPHL